MLKVKREIFINLIQHVVPFIHERAFVEIGMECRSFSGYYIHR
jgi:hypothetical protein